MKDEGGQHPFYFRYFIHEGAAFPFIQEAKISSKQRKAADR
jgi:hypothetical protein